MLQDTLKTLNDLKESQFESYILYDKKLTTNRSALSALKSRFKQLKTHFVDIPFNRQTFTEFLATERARGISETTLNKLISCAKHIAHMRGQTDIDDFSYFREKKKEVETLTWDEMRKLADVRLPYRLSKDGISSDEQNLRMWCYITLMSEIGCRKSEALKLKWDDLKPYTVTFRLTKNGDDRTVPITPLLYQQMRKLTHRTDCVFGLSEIAREPELDLKRRAAVIGLTKPIYNHVIRHSVASYLLNSKAPLKIVCNIMGWKDPKTANRYDQNGVSEMEELLNTYSRVFKEHMSYETMIEKVKDFLNTFVDNKVGVLYISQSCDKLEIQITNADTKRVATESN